MRDIVSPLSGFASPFGQRRKGPSGPSASGGTETVIQDGANFYRVHTFTEGGTLTVTRGGLFEYLVVGGGGAAYHGASANGGGPGGSVKTGALILAAAQFAVAVGSGARSAYSGGQSDVVPATASSFSEITAPPGGFGAGAFDTATEGGGGSVGNDSFPDGAVNSDTGFTGGNGGGTNNSTFGGGGGAGAGGDGESAAGGNAGDGGPGVKSSITGEEKGYGGGGGGSHRSSNEQAGSGVDGGGDGVTVGSPGQSGEPNTGGGAGGGYSGSEGVAPTGGSGIVILRYRITEEEYNEEAA